MKKRTFIILLTISLFSNFCCFGQKNKIDVPAISINSIFLKKKSKNGVDHYSYHYKEKHLKNKKYIIYFNRLINKKGTDFQNNITNNNEGDDIIMPESDFTIGKSTGIASLGFFNDGYKNGFWKTTYKNKLVKTENWNNGLIFGKYKVTNTEGKLLYQTNFGSKGNGKYKDFYYNTGSLRQEGNYENGKKQGEWCDYDEYQKLLKITKYEKGIIIKE